MGKGRLSVFSLLLFGRESGHGKVPGRGSRGSRGNIPKASFRGVWPRVSARRPVRAKVQTATVFMYYITSTSTQYLQHQLKHCSGRHSCQSVVCSFVACIVFHAASGEGTLGALGDGPWATSRSRWRSHAWWS